MAGVRRAGRSEARARRVPRARSALRAAIAPSASLLGRPYRAVWHAHSASSVTEPYGMVCVAITQEANRVRGDPVSAIVGSVAGRRAPRDRRLPHLVGAVAVAVRDARQDLARNVVGRPEGDLPPIFVPLSILVGALLGHGDRPTAVGLGRRDGGSLAGLPDGLRSRRPCRGAAECLASSALAGRFVGCARARRRPAALPLPRPARRTRRCASCSAHSSSW